MKAVKKIFHKDSPGSGVDTGGSKPECSGINTSNSETGISDSQKNSPAPEQMIAAASDFGPGPEVSTVLGLPLEPDSNMALDSFLESASKSTTMWRSTPSPQPTKALQGLFSKLHPHSGVSSEDSGAQCFLEEPLDQGSGGVVQQDGETSQLTDTQQESLSPLKSDCNEKMTSEPPALNTMEQQKTEGTPSNGKGVLKLPHISPGSEDVLQNSDQENTLDGISREPLKVKTNVCTTIKKNILPSILCGSTKTCSGQEKKGKIQGKIRNFVFATLGKKEPRKTTPTSADTQQMTETCQPTVAVKDKGSYLEAELSKPQALKLGTDRAQVRRRAFQEPVQKKSSQRTQPPGQAKTREATSKPRYVQIADYSYRDSTRSRVPPAGPAHPQDRRRSTMQSSRRDTRQPTQQSSSGIQTTRHASVPRPSIASNRAQVKEFKRTTNELQQADRPTQESRRAKAGVNTAIQRPERKDPQTVAGKISSTASTRRRHSSMSSGTTRNQSQTSRSESYKERNTGSTDKAQSMEATKRRNTISHVAQAHKLVHESSKDQTSHTSIRRKYSTTKDRNSSTQRPVTNRMAQGQTATHDKGQKLQQDPQRGQTRKASIKTSTMNSEDQARRTHPATEFSGIVIYTERRRSTVEKNKPVPADRDKAEATAQCLSSQKTPTSASVKNQSQQAKDLATVVPGKPHTQDH